MFTFDALRAANVARIPTFKNAQGVQFHASDGSDWSLEKWMNAVLGELGEAANIIKKIGRGDFSLESARPALAKEFADVLTYLDILAFRCGVDLGAATLQKFNEISARVGSPIKIDPNEKWPYDERIVDEKPEANIERRSWCPAWEVIP